MRKIILRWFVVAQFIGLGLINQAATISAKEETLQGTFTLVKGKVLLQKKKEKIWRTVELYLPVQVSDRIKTEKKSEAEVTFDDGTVLRIEPKTVITVEKAIINQKTKKKLFGLGLSSGRALTNVKKLVHPKSKFEFITPTAVIAVRGTEFVVDARKTGIDTKVAVFEGRVGVSGKVKKPEEILVKSEQETVIKKGKDPFPPSPLSKEFLRYRKQVVTKFEKRVARYRARLDKIKQERTKKMEQQKKKSLERMEEMRRKFEEKQKLYEE